MSGVNELYQFPKELVSSFLSNFDLKLPYGLTPLHFAACLNRMDLVTKLLALRPGDVNARDHRQWTPLHHAALVGNREMVKLFLMNKADGQALNDAGGTFADILRLVEPPQHPDDELINLSYANTEDKVSQLTMKRFKELTGASFLHENHVDRAFMVEDWKANKLMGIQKTPYSETIRGSFKKKYTEFQINPPQHIIRTVTHDDNKKPLPFSPGLGVFAQTDFKVGDVIGEYKAHVGPEDVTDYTLDKYWQGLNERNEIPIVNDGSPNAMMVVIDNVRGLSARCLLVAIAPIKAGTQFCYNYASNHQIKKGIYLEFRGNDIREFVNTCDMAMVLGCIQRVYQNFSEASFEDQCIFQKIYYLIETPKIMFQMVWDGSVPSARLNELVNAFLTPAPRYVDVQKTQLELIFLAEVCFRLKRILEDDFSTEIERRLSSETTVQLLEFLRDKIPPIMEQIKALQV